MPCQLQILTMIYLRGAGLSFRGFDWCQTASKHHAIDATTTGQCLPKEDEGQRNPLIATPPYPRKAQALSKNEAS